MFVNILVVCALKLVVADDFESTLKPLRPVVRDEDQSAAALGVIQRLIPDRVSEFKVSVNSSLGPAGKDTFIVQKGESDDVVQIVGTSGVAVAWGFHHYLKYFCQCHVSWEADQLNLPQVMPTVNLTITSLDRLRYYQNVCTSSYSFVWWDWQRWEREIDWMALNGINFALATNGQEAIWERVYQKLNLSSNEVAAHFTGPAFLAWQRMGNIRGWAGPLPLSWHVQSLALQHRILGRMRQLGITPILPAFAGQVPRAFKRLYPDINMTELAVWNKFSDEYCCPYLIEPTDPLFQHVGKLFLTEVITEFGTNHAYYCDTFNEMLPSFGDLQYLANVSRAVYQAMQFVDTDAVWVKQNWEFVNKPLFWTLERVEAFLTSVPLGRMIILDLQSEQHERYTVFSSYFGQPFIWCMLHNFGATLGLFGSLHIINNKVFEGRNFIKNSTMVGTGLTPEGINQNYVVYDLMNEMAWRTHPANLSQWIAMYATRRYGEKNVHATVAWELLKSSVYNFTGLGKMRGKYIINVRPSLRLQPYAWYNILDVADAWSEMLNASVYLGSAATFQHDLVDVTRQAAELLASSHYVAVVRAYKARNVTAFQDNARAMLDLLSDIDELLASNGAFLLGKWLHAAKAKGTTDGEEQLYEYNARNQITLWGPDGQIRDYANKQWAGIVSHYFRPRWQMFLNALESSLVYGTNFSQTVLNKQLFQQVEMPFTVDRSIFPVGPTGDSIEIARRIYEHWYHKFSTFNSTGLFSCWIQRQHDLVEEDFHYEVLSV